MNKYIENKAKKLIKKHNTRNPFELAKAMNINVRFYNFKKLKGFYTYHRRNRYIGINRNLCDIEQQLCCTHEISHDQLHRHLTYYMKDYNIFTNVKTEYEANLMAAHILVPDNLLDKYSGLNFSVEQIAAIEKLYPDLIKLKFKDLSIF
ncbi:MAG: ImmA/IrrE family metallo-endopeptidase [Clostridia bacterium]|nr:ImmA/IrrE family metallo-endopeptidase [Clostridia bacterium]